MQHIYADYGTWPTNLSISLLQDFGFHLAYLTPVAFALNSIYHSQIKTMLIFFPLTILAGLQSYELNVGTILVTAIVAYFIGILLSDLVSFLIDKKEHLKARFHFITLYTVLLVPMILFMLNMNILSSQSGPLENKAFAEQETFLTFDKQIAVTPLFFIMIKPRQKSPATLTSLFL